MTTSRPLLATAPVQRIPPAGGRTVGRTTGLERVIATLRPAGESARFAPDSARIASRRAAAVLRGAWPGRFMDLTVRTALRPAGRPR